MPNISKQLLGTSVPPKDTEEFNAWLELKDIIPFLKSTERQSEFPIYAGLGQTFLHSMVVPNKALDPIDIDDLLSWNFGLSSSSWSIWESWSEEPSIWLSSTPETSSKTLDQGEELIFYRRFDGYAGDKNYFEILQKVVHILDIHFMPERNAYCQLDENGDIEDVIRIAKATKSEHGTDGTVVSSKRDELDRYLALTDSSIVQTFDFTRFRSSGFGGWTKHDPEYHREDPNLFYRSVIEPAHASYMRGCQIVRSRITRKDLVRGPSAEEKAKQYASFLALDWKNGGVVKEISCAPGATANYFTESPLPFETTPAFFRPEVLAKYKADTDKYRLKDRSITCRGTWHLETYDINEQGQVHTYLVYLRRLPYQEQLHWRAHNEAPKGPIAKRAYKTDFEACWDLDYEPLQSLREKLEKLSETEAPWWTLRSAKLLEQIHHPVTSSTDEWAEEVLHLDQLLVEGFEERWLRRTVASLGRNPDDKWRSLRLVEECLIGTGFGGDHARTIMSPLHEVHNLRSKVKGHASGQEAAKIKYTVLKKHQTYSEHFRTLCQQCDETIQIITSAFAKLT